MCSTKAFWPTSPSTPTRSPPRPSIAYQPIGGIHDEFSEADEPLAAQAGTAAASSGSGAGAAAKKAPVKKAQLSPKEERGSALQKIAKLDIKGRIQLAMKGSKEERSLLIRDGTKIVALAVLESPKISDGEVERFATQKNVLEAVLRGIPDEAALRQELRGRSQPGLQSAHSAWIFRSALMKNMLVGDLRNLSKQQRDFRHRPQAGHEDVQAEDGEQQQALIGTEPRGLCWLSRRPPHYNPLHGFLA